MANVGVQNVFSPFSCVLKTTIYSTFPCLAVLAAVLNFDHGFKHELKKQIKKFQPDGNIFSSPEAGQCNSLTVALLIAPVAISRESKSQEHENKIIILKINNYFFLAWF